jgi:two-component system sensor histidine kinase DevS
MRATYRGHAISRAPAAARQRDAELELRREEVANLRRGLEETNRGLVALHAEFEDARQAEVRLAAIVQSSDDAMYSMTAGRVIDGCNRGVERLLGYAAVEVVGQPIESLVPDELRFQLDAAVARLQAGERAISFDAWRERKDGAPIEVAITVSAMRDPGDRLVGYAAVLRDLSDRRKAEAELAAARAAREVMAARDQIARDLHDGTIQAIFGVGMQLQATATMTRDAAMRERLEGMVAQLDVVISDLRRHIFRSAGPWSEA